MIVCQPVRLNGAATLPTNCGKILVALGTILIGGAIASALIRSNVSFNRKAVAISLGTTGTLALLSSLFFLKIRPGKEKKIDPIKQGILHNLSHTDCQWAHRGWIDGSFHNLENIAISREEVAQALLIRLEKYDSLDLFMWNLVQWTPIEEILSLPVESKHRKQFAASLQKKLDVTLEQRGGLALQTREMGGWELLFDHGFLKIEVLKNHFQKINDLDLQVDIISLYGIRMVLLVANVLPKEKLEKNYHHLRHQFPDLPEAFEDFYNGL